MQRLAVLQSLIPLAAASTKSGATFDGIATDFSIRLHYPIYRKRSKQRHDGNRNISEPNRGTVQENLRDTCMHVART